MEVGERMKRRNYFGKSARAMGPPLRVSVDRCSRIEMREIFRPYTGYADWELRRTVLSEKMRHPNGCSIAIRSAVLTQVHTFLSTGTPPATSTGHMPTGNLWQYLNVRL